MGMSQKVKPQKLLSIALHIHFLFFLFKLIFPYRVFARYT